MDRILGNQRERQARSGITWGSRGCYQLTTGFELPAVPRIMTHIQSLLRGSRGLSK